METSTDGKEERGTYEVQDGTSDDGVEGGRAGEIEKAIKAAEADG